MMVQPSQPNLVYFEANTLVYWLLPTLHSPPLPNNPLYHQQAHNALRVLISIFSKHRVPNDPQRVDVITSQWALTEAHSVLYKDALWENGIVPSWEVHNPKYDPRKDCWPPHVSSLQKASLVLTTEMNRLELLVNLVIPPPDAETWEIALRLAKECAIYAPDSLHLATALAGRCNLIITQDTDFINKIHHFRNGPIAQIIQELSRAKGSNLGPPSFEACPLLLSSRIRKKGYQLARSYLARQGYV